MTNLKIYKEKTILVKRDGEKISVDIPYNKVTQAMAKDILHLGDGHSIRTKAINEWYAYPVTNELEFRLENEYKGVVLKEVKKFLVMRQKKKFIINKQVITNYVNNTLLKENKKFLSA